MEPAPATDPVTFARSGATELPPAAGRAVQAMGLIALDREPYGQASQARCGRVRDHATQERRRWPSLAEAERAFRGRLARSSEPRPPRVGRSSYRVRTMVVTLEAGRFSSN